MEGPEKVASDRATRKLRGLGLFLGRYNKTVRLPYS